MRGEVLHYDEEQGFGFITGADGNGYSFRYEDLRRDMVAKGARVEFQPNGDRASNILPVDGQPADPASGPAPAPMAARPMAPRPAAMRASAGSAPAATAHFGRDAGNVATEPTGLWGYFWRALREDCLNFSGRARRKEFWGFCLFWTIGFIVLAVAGLVVDLGVSDLASNGEPFVMLSLVVLFTVLTILPWIALLARRLHDIGMTGWLAILCFIPSLGWLVTVVFGLIPTQAGANRWGPAPAGVDG